MGDCMLRLSGVSKCYGGSKKAVDNINLKIEKGDICALIGHNGAGKTTTLKMITGILSTSEGDIYIDGENIEHDLIEIKKKIAYVPDKPIVLLELTGNEYLDFVSSMYDIEVKRRITYVEKLAEILKIKDYLNSKIQSYSHGMRKKLMIIGAFLSGAKVLILDEPLAGLDPEAIYIMKNLIKEYVDKGNCVIFSTHLLDIAKDVCNKFVFMNKGRIKFVGDEEYIELKYGENASLESIFMEIIKDE